MTTKKPFEIADITPGNTTLTGRLGDRVRETITTTFSPIPLGGAGWGAGSYSSSTDITLYKSDTPLTLGGIEAAIEPVVSYGMHSNDAGLKSMAQELRHNLEGARTYMEALGQGFQMQLNDMGQSSGKVFKEQVVTANNAALSTLKWNLATEVFNMGRTFPEDAGFMAICEKTANALHNLGEKRKGVNTPGV